MTKVSRLKHLTVEDPGAVEARRLDALDETHQTGMGSVPGTRR